MASSKVSQIAVNSFCAIIGALVGGLALHGITKSNVPRIQQTQTVGRDSVNSPQVLRLSKYGMGTGDGDEADLQLSFFHGFKKFSSEFDSAFTVTSSDVGTGTVTISFEAYRELLRSKRAGDKLAERLEPYYRQLMRALTEKRAGMLETSRGRRVPVSGPTRE